MRAVRFAFAFAPALASLALASLALAACAGGEPASAGADDELTSATALARELAFQGRVYVAPDASDDAILRAVREQTRTAFGALRTSEIAVNHRELAAVDPATFRTRIVRVVDTDRPEDAPTERLEVAYTYTDDAVVSKAYARRTTAPLALLSPGYTRQTERVLRECTANDTHARDFASSLWYVFEPRLDACRRAIEAEEADLAAAREALPSKDDVAKREVERLYLPVTARLGADKTNRGKSYPEYDRLFTGGVEPGKLVVSMVYGLIDHGEGSPADDFNFGEFATHLDEVFTAHPGFRFVRTEPATDLATFRLEDGRELTIDPDRLVDALKGRAVEGVAAADRRALVRAIAAKIERRWVVFERPVKVTIGGGEPRDFTVAVHGYFGADKDATPHKQGIKRGDVFLYNGHSYIGAGPLDPNRFTKADFPSSYQILFIDGCVSYNYYEKDYVPLKEGGTKNLDLVTNGLEAPAWRGGYALGKFTAALLGGQASYRELLEQARDTDELRVVDGEVDNAYTPESAPIVVTPR